MMILTQQSIDRIIRNRNTEPYNTFYNSVENLCNRFLKAETPCSDRTRTSWMLVQSRFMQRALVTLSGFYRVTGDKRYADKVLNLLEDLTNWKSWCMNGQDGADDFRFDLATAELAVALAFTLDWIGDYIPQRTREILYSMIEDRIFKAFIETIAPENKKAVWWYDGVTNWNSVCSGGAACLAYYMSGESELAGRVIGLAEKSLDTYLAHMHGDGSNEEGISYWMYGMMFLLYAFISYESAAGKKHHAFELDAMKNGLQFFFDLTVREDHMSFSDNGETTPVGILYALAERVGNENQAKHLTYRFMELKHILDNPPLYSEFPTHIFWVQWPSEIFMLLLCPEYCMDVKREVIKRKPLTIYPSNGWGVFSSGNLVLSFRSGTTRENHAMHDLNSVQLAEKGTILLQDMRGNPYPVGWFGKSRELFPESNTQGKNSMLFNGIGQLTYNDAEWGYDSSSMWSDAAPAYPEFARKAKRTVTVTDTGFVFNDEFEASTHTWHEIRFVSYGKFVRLGDHKWKVEKEGAAALMEFESDADIECLTCDMPVSIAVRAMPRILRIFTKNRVLASNIKTFIKEFEN